MLVSLRFKPFEGSFWSSKGPRTECGDYDLFGWVSSINLGGVGGSHVSPVSGFTLSTGPISFVGMQGTSMVDMYLHTIQYSVYNIYIYIIIHYITIIYYVLYILLYIAPSIAPHLEEEHSSCPCPRCRSQKITPKSRRFLPELKCSKTADLELCK